MPQLSGTVLIVDDDAAVRGALKFALETEGLVVRLYDGPEALLADPALPPRSCLVIDYRMPTMDGIELIEALRLRHVTLPTIMITGRANQSLRSRAAVSGVREVLEKPLSDGALVDNIRSIFAAGG